MSLRNSLVAKIWGSLEKSPFTAADFDVAFGDRNDDLCKIVFRHHPQFSFTLQQDVDGQILATLSPGEHRKTEQYVFQSFSAVPKQVLEWSRYVRDELRAMLPIYAELDELRRAIDDHVAAHVKEPERTFTMSEADELRRKLEELTEKFADLAEKHKITTQELNRLDQEVTSIKANIATYPKGTWYKTAATRLWVTITSIVNSKEGRLVLAQAARRALGLPGPSGD